MTIYEIIESVATIGSTKAKQEILEANKSNEVLKNCFFYAENPRVNFFIRMGESREVVAPSHGRDLSMADFLLLDRLIKRDVTGNDARQWVGNIMEPLNNGAREILCRIIDRDLRCGAGTSISNKVWKNLIPEYPVMLASKFDAKAEKYLSQFENKAGFVVQKKCDGGRVNIKVGANGVVTYYSRAGNELNLFGVFDYQFSRFTDTVFDGELLVRSKTGVEARTVGNGLYTKAVRNTLTQQEAQRFSIEIWDVIPILEFNNGIGNVPYRERLARLDQMKFDENVTVVESKQVRTLAECVEFYEEMRARGEEGAIIKVAGAVWEDARSKSMVKMKAICDVDALCIGVEPGTGKYAGMIGNLICQDSTGALLFNVGTGLTDADRTKDASAYVGKIVECVYNEIISAKNKSTKSLFLPVFKQVRMDKKIANSLCELK